MTFTEIRTEIKDRLNLTSSTADTRLGNVINRAYKKITSALGLNVTRRTQVQADVTEGVQTLTFTGIEKVLAVIDKTTGVDRHLDEVYIDELKQGPIGTGAPSKFAIYRMNGTTVQIYMDTVPQEVFTLYADGYVTAGTLSGSDVPAFPESFHDVLVEAVLYEEYLKGEKTGLAEMAKENYEDRLNDLKFFIAKSAFQDSYVGKNAKTSAISGSVSGSSGSTPNGATSYAQTGLITFDRGSAVAPFAVDDSDAAVVTNLDADKLDGQHGAYYRDASNLNAGTVPLARLSGITNTEISASAAIAYSKLNLTGLVVNTDIGAAAAIAWTKISKAGSSLADLATRSAADLNSGSLPVARLALGTFSVVTSTVTGAQNNWAPTLAGNTLIEWSGASAAAFTGLDGGVAGQIVTIKNTGSAVATFAHGSGSSDADNRFVNIVAAPTPVAAGGCIVYQHDGTNWKLITHEQGVAINVPYTAGDFTANSGNWTVDELDKITFEYHLKGNMLTVNFVIGNTDVSATPTSLRMLIPGGFTVAKRIEDIGYYSDNGGANAVGVIDVNPAANTLISFFHLTITDTWATTSSDNTSIHGCVTFAVTAGA